MNRTEYTHSVWLYDDDWKLIRMYAKQDTYERHERGGKLHREDGPAVICPHYVAWYVNGERVREERGRDIGEQHTDR
jgi:hypothetical protein